MARIIILALLVAAASAQLVPSYTTPVPILRQANINDGDGNFQYSFETGDGVAVDARGTLKNRGREDEAQVIEGRYAYYSPEGQLYTITYVADDQGFRAQGDHLPTPPPIPAEILRSLQVIDELNKRKKK